jgi:tripartite-type tricarboxylate transporter receptor subunit TctC
MAATAPKSMKGCGLAAASAISTADEARAAGATRADVLPDVPTVGEFVPGYEAIGWVGVGAPRRTPDDITGKLNKEIDAVLADPKMKARIADLGYTTFSASPSDFAKFIAKETEK